MKKLIFGLGLAFSLALLPGIASAAVTPVPLSPKNNAVGYNVNTTFLQWTRVPEAGSYTLQFNKNNNNFVGDGIPIDNGDNYKLVSALDGANNDGATYYWRVKVTGNENNWSSTFKFSTVADANKATNLSPNLYRGNPTVVDLNAKETTFSWRNDKNTAYNSVSLYLANYNSENKKWVCGDDRKWTKNFVGTSFPSRLLIKQDLTNSANDIAYCWKVTSYSNNGNPIVSEPGFFKFYNLRDNASLRVTPLFAQYNFGQLVMYWSKAKVGGDESYTIRIADNAKMEDKEEGDFNNNYLVVSDGALYNYLQSKLGKKLYWQVKVGDNWSHVASFQPSSLSKPTLNSPVDGVSGKATTTTFTWNNPAGKAIFYKLEFVNVQDNSKKAVYYTTNRSYKPAASHASTAIFVDNSGGWTWTVTAYNNNSMSLPSEPRTFNQQ